MPVVTLDLISASRFERVTVVTPLGIRFWDAARDAQVDDGLEVTARPQARPDAPPVRAFKTASGVYAFRGLPGLERFEHPQDEPDWPDTTQFIFDVVDRLGRFLPIRFIAPAPHEGLLLSPGVISPPSRVPGFYLFSAPGRSAAAGTAAVRADLIDTTTRRGAAYAVVEVLTDGVALAVGIADERGCVAVLFPYPEFRRRLNASPPGALPPDQQSWPLRVRVRYVSPTQSSPPRQTPAGERPDLRTILSQPRAEFLTSAADTGPGVSELTIDLLFGQELSLQGPQEPGIFIRGAPP
jgi:hypothetical protein